MGLLCLDSNSYIGLACQALVIKNFFLQSRSSRRLDSQMLLFLPRPVLQREGVSSKSEQRDTQAGNAESHDDLHL